VQFISGTSSASSKMRSTTSCLRLDWPEFPNTSVRMLSTVKFEFFVEPVSLSKKKENYMPFYFTGYGTVRTPLTHILQNAPHELQYAVNTLHDLQLHCQQSTRLLESPAIDRSTCRCTLVMFSVLFYIRKRCYRWMALWLWARSKLAYASNLACDLLNRSS
jgi:hypothetical protein